MLIARINDSDFFGGEPIFIDNVSRYGVRGILLNDDKQIAVMKIENTAYYKLPGGSIEITETPKQAFVRELLEETGYEAEIITELGWIEEHKNKRKSCLVSHCYVAKTLGGFSAEALAKSEEKLGFKLEWMPFKTALDTIIKASENCNDYQMKFLLRREQLILENAKDLI